MNRTLTAAVALTATLGTAGLTLAQGYTPGTNAPTPGMTSTPAPATGASPAMTPGSSATPSMSPGAATNQQSMQGQPGAGQNGQLASPVNIQQAQQQLRTQGLYNGAIDGQLGPEMKTAIKQFQQRNGLPQTGMLDQQTSARLSQSGNNNLSPTPTSGSTMPSAAGARQTNPPNTDH